MPRETPASVRDRVNKALERLEDKGHLVANVLNTFNVSMQTGLMIATKVGEDPLRSPVIRRPSTDPISAAYSYASTTPETPVTVLPLCVDLPGVDDAGAPFYVQNMQRLLAITVERMNEHRRRASLSYHTPAHGIEMFHDNAFLAKLCGLNEWSLFAGVCGLFHDIVFTRNKYDDEVDSAEELKEALQPFIHGLPSEDHKQVFRDLIDAMIVGGTTLMFSPAGRGETMPQKWKWFKTKVLWEESYTARTVDRVTPPHMLAIFKLLRNIGDLDAKRSLIPEVLRVSPGNGEILAALDPTLANIMANALDYSSWATVPGELQLQRVTNWGQCFRFIAEEGNKEERKGAGADSALGVTAYVLKDLEKMFFSMQAGEGHISGEPYSSAHVTPEMISHFLTKTAGEIKFARGVCLGLREQAATLAFQPRGELERPYTFDIDSWEMHIAILEQMRTHLSDDSKPIAEKQNMVFWMLSNAAYHQHGRGMQRENLLVIADPAAALPMGVGVCAEYREAVLARARPFDTALLAQSDRLQVTVVGESSEIVLVHPDPVITAREALTRAEATPLIVTAASASTPALAREPVSTSVPIEVPAGSADAEVREIVEKPASVHNNRFHLAPLPVRSVPMVGAGAMSVPTRRTVVLVDDLASKHAVTKAAAEATARAEAEAREGRLAFDRVTPGGVTIFRETALAKTNGHASSVTLRPLSSMGGASGKPAEPHYLASTRASAVRSSLAQDQVARARHGGKPPGPFSVAHDESRSLGGGERFTPSGAPK